MRPETVEKVMQHIETAPKDGSRLLFYFKKLDVYVSGHWHTEEERNDPSVGHEPAWSWWVTDDDLIVMDGGPSDVPDGWMYLPDDARASIAALESQLARVREKIEAICLNHEMGDAMRKEIDELGELLREVLR